MDQSLGRRTEIKNWWLFAIILVLSIATLSTALTNQTRLQPGLDVFDEGAHLAYVIELSHGHIPVWGDLLPQQARSIIDCTSSVKLAPARCGSRPAPAQNYAAGGYVYEAQQPPLAYLAYLPFLSSHLSGTASVIHLRLGGMIWIGLSAILILILGYFEELSLIGVTALAATSLLSPVFTHAAGTVNNDAAGVACGLAVLIAVAWSRRLSWWLGLVLGTSAGFIAGGMKGLFVLLPFALVITLAITGFDQIWNVKGWPTFLRKNSAVLGAFVGSVGAYFLWTLIQRFRETTSSKVVLHALLGFSHTDHFMPSAIVNGFVSQLQLFNSYTGNQPLNVIWGVIAMGIVLGTLFLPAKTREAVLNRNAAWGLVGAFTAISIGWPLLVFLQGHYNFSAATRYAIPLLPLVALILIRACTKRGLLAAGVLLPVAAGLWQLAVH